jgi:hypothetical protein
MSEIQDAKVCKRVRIIMAINQLGQGVVRLATAVDPRGRYSIDAQSPKPNHVECPAISQVRSSLNPKNKKHETLRLGLLIVLHDINQSIRADPTNAFSPLEHRRHPRYEPWIAPLSSNSGAPPPSLSAKRAGRLTCTFI